MRKLINNIALILFIWLLLDAFHVLNILLNFILVGAIPGMTISLPPTTMLAIMSILAMIVILELLARRISVMRQIRQNIFTLVIKNERLPRSRFNRI